MVAYVSVETEGVDCADEVAQGYTEVVAYAASGCADAAGRQETTVDPTRVGC